VSASKPLIVAIVGPTASGKSDLALRLAEEIGGDVVNADALQVYRGLDVGTAKPTAQERARVRHHLLDVVDPTQRFSAGDFARRARAVLAELADAGRPALVVGGSGFYLRALFEGLSPLPRAHPEIRAELRARAEAEGAEALHDELRSLDAPSAERIARRDVQRIVRALEVQQVTGLPLSEWIARRPAPFQPLSALHVGLTLPRAILYDHVAVRVERMVGRGWVDEVKLLLAQGVPYDAPAFQAIGYRQIVRCVRGELDLPEAIDETIRATRRFAKRQMTWFRKESQVRWFDPRVLAEDMSDVLRLLRSSG